jgi:pyruvate-formate lyase
MAANWDRPALTRMGLALEHILDSVSVVIRDDELIVGCRTSKLKGAPLFPENKWKWIEGDHETLPERVLQEALIRRAWGSEEIHSFWHAERGGLPTLLPLTY